MTKKTLTLERMIEDLASDVLDPDYPIELVEQELRDAGIDPEKVAENGKKLVEELRKKHGRTRST